MPEQYKDAVDYKTHNCILLAANRAAGKAVAGTGTHFTVFRPVNIASDALDEVLQTALEDTLDELNTVK